jgi:hypothetical protein
VSNAKILSVHDLLSRWPLPAALLLSAAGVTAQSHLVEALHDPVAEHVDQLELFAMIGAGRYEEAYELAFELGDELFAARFNVLDGVGANVGDGQRFTRVPRADLAGNGQWADHFPARSTGPNAESCNACHLAPFEDGSGPAAANVHRDPLHRAAPSALIQRNTPPLFALGAVQRLAEEMTARLRRTRAEAAAEAARTGRSVRRGLEAKGVRFGSITAHADGSFDTRSVEGVDPDLVVRPFQWKGSVAFLRDFNRDAAHNELGMQGVEIVGDADGDGDRVRRELSIGDMTALTVYLAAQPRPTSLLELSLLGLLDPPLSVEQSVQILRGLGVLYAAGCARCHVPLLRLEDPIFREPSADPSYRDEVFPAGQDPLALGVDPGYPVSFDLTSDQPDNQIRTSDGKIFHLGALRTDGRGRALVLLYGDLKRHDMGRELAEPIDEKGTGASVFMTESLWGVGSTAPYLHDGRATTLTEAILLHGGEARFSRDLFAMLPRDWQRDLIAFLENLVLFKLPEEEEHETAVASTALAGQDEVLAAIESASE